MANYKEKAFHVTGCYYTKNCDSKRVKRLVGVLTPICSSPEGCSQQIYGFYDKIIKNKKSK
jgi:hypothetical protein